MKKEEIMIDNDESVDKNKLRAEDQNKKNIRVD